MDKLIKNDAFEMELRQELEWNEKPDTKQTFGHSKGHGRFQNLIQVIREERPLSGEIVTWLDGYDRPGVFEEISLVDALAVIGSDRYQTEIENLRRIEDKTAYAKSKRELPCIAFNGRFSERVTNDHFTASSRLFHFDLDHLEGDIDVHKAKIAAIPSCVFVFVSPSGTGLKGALHVPPTAIQNDDDFKRLFHQVASYFKQVGYDIDNSCKDVRRLCFVSHDPDVYVNWDAEVFSCDLLSSPVEAGTGLAIAPIEKTIVFNSFDDSSESPCIQRVTRILEKAEAGGRHQARLKAGKLAGGFIAGGLVDESKMLDILCQYSDAIADKRVTDSAELRTLLDAVKYGKGSPIDTLDGDLDELGDLTSSITEGLRFNRPNLPGTDARDGTHNTRPLSELGNAYRLLDAHGGNIHYVYDAKAWLHWQEGAWMWDVDGAVTRQLAAHLPSQIYHEGSRFLAESQEFAKWSRNSQKERTIKAAVSLLEDREEVRLPLAVVDANPLLVGINDARQVIDLESGAIRAASQSDYITKTLNVSQLGESSRAERFHAFLGQVFGDDPELINWLKRWCGYLLTGAMNEQIFVFCYGLGANGKSVFADILRFILGDYARAIASESITESRRQAGGATPDLADLIGARLAISSETEDGAALAESLVKSLVAGDTMSVRKLYCSPVQFTPQFKLMILGNHKPVIKGNDYGVWRRIRLIPFTRTFTENERDPYLLDKLKAEASDILAWMVEGCLEWQLKGLANIPLNIKQATSDYQEEQDLIGNWLAECCELSPLNETASTNLYENYSHWCVRNGSRPYSNVALGRKLSERGFKASKVNGGRCWVGLTVKESSDSGL